jgi:predicted transposase/invertase (TIGR01784 family)
VEHLSGEQHVEIAEPKLSIVDVKCTDTTGRRFVVEMQVLKVEGFEKRVVYNASKAYVMQLRNAEEYPALCDVVGVTLCNFNLWPDKDAQGNFKVPMLSRWRMQEQHSGERGLSQVQYVFLELPKYAAASTPTTLIDKWAYFFREAKNLNVVPPALAEGPFCDAMEIARTSNFSSYEWQAYERAKMSEQDARGALTIVRQEGKEEGMREGMREGIREGLSEGILRGKREALLLLLAHRSIDLTDEHRTRIATCTDSELLDRWFQRALTATSVAEIIV